MAFIALICSTVMAVSAELLCAGISVVSMGVWLAGEALDSAMVASTNSVS